MPLPIPWSHTALRDFLSCPWSFHETRVTKRIKREQGEEAEWGEYVHKQFERRQIARAVLPPPLLTHEAYMKKIEAISGTLAVEQKIAFDKRAQPCGFFDQQVWFRGVIDWKKVCVPDRRATLIDYKTGKQKDDFAQLGLFALHTFAAHPEVDLVDTRYFWTQTGLETRKVYGRAEIPALWANYIPDLRQYALAFKDDAWPKRQSGLCNGWCPVTDCEHWRPKRLRR
jgi:hypothetical protein